MSSARSFRPGLWIAALLGVAFVALVGLRVKQATAVSEPDPSVEQLREERGVPVRLATATVGALEVWRPYNGTVSGIREGVVRARSDVQVLEVPVTLGSRVGQGALLVRLSGEAVEARLRQAEVGARQAARTVERLRPLREAGALSEQDWEQALTQLELAEADRDAARDALALTSPLAGVVTELQARPGMIPSSGDPLVRVADLSRLVVRLHVSTSEAAGMSVGDPVRVVGAGSAAGQVRRISLQADPVTRLVEVEAEFPADPALVAGTLAAVEVRVAERQEVVRIPAEAMISSPGGDGSFAWVVEGEDRVTRRALEVGVEGDDQVEVLSGISAGERVVVEGGSLLGEGARIREVSGNGAEG